MLMALQLGPAAAAADRPQAPVIGKPGCNTTCGEVIVPYPFGFGDRNCYWPGLNLTCDTSHHPPRLLIGGDTTLRVTDIFLNNATMRVMRKGSIINTTGDFTSDSWNVSFGHGFTEYGYGLAYSANELVVSGCNVMAMVLADIGQTSPYVISGCATFCSNGYVEEDEFTGKYCTGTSDCCQAPIAAYTSPDEVVVQAKWLDRGNHTADQDLVPVNVFLAEKGWAEEAKAVRADELEEAPLLLGWNVMRGLPNLTYGGDCSNDEVSPTLCKSEHSECWAMDGYTCSCEGGYHGNAYLAGGCQG